MNEPPPSTSTEIVEEDEENSDMENSEDTPMEDPLFGLVDEVPLILLEEISWFEEDQEIEPSDDEPSDEEQTPPDEEETEDS
ncbi:MAG: hypothetical protein OSA48_05755 [Akkermansiaceae bacterium]|nr:hypothetical protein [Akkermansiaceae bacterium]